MHHASWAHAPGQELRIDSDIRASINHHSARRQNLSHKLPFSAIRVAFEGAVERSINWKSCLVKLISNPAAKAGSSRHYLRVSVMMKNEASSLGKARLRITSNRKSTL